MRSSRKLQHILASGALVLALIASTSVPALAKSGGGTGRGLSPDTRFFTPPPNKGAIKQIAQLIAAHHFADALLIGKMIATPQAVWFTSGTPQSIQQDVKKTVKLAAAQRAVPVLVIYNIPGRDCALYSAGGAATGDDYKAWIDGFVAGLGSQKVVVIVEPDGLALLPTDCGQPDTYDRVGLINYAAHALLADPNASIYLDAGNSLWHTTGDIATRLVAAGVQDINGFALDVSNYQFSPNLAQYGTWVSKCIAYATQVNPGDYGSCPHQYWNGGPLPSKIAVLRGEWNGLALDPYNIWSDDSDTDALNTSGINLRYANMLGSVQPTVHFVADTSRDGQGPWVIPAHPAGDAQDWCNPPDRGVGLRPTANTGVALLDAYLWIKIPGESDGLCYRWTSGPLDPVRGIADPAAGTWFPEMALELARNASPAFP